MDKLRVLQHVYSHSLDASAAVSVAAAADPPLLPHQVRMVEAMIRHRDRMITGFMGDNQEAINGKLGILGDAAGSGKTRCVLTYLERTWRDPISQLTNELVDTSSSFFYSHRMRSIEPDQSANLIIVPHSVFHQWYDELKHYPFPSVALETRRVLRIHDPAMAQHMREAVCVLTTNTCYKWVNQYAEHHRIRWNQVVIDEASTIHFQATDPPLRFQFLWLVSHSWMPLLFKHTPIQVRSLYGIIDALPPAERAQMDPELIEWCHQHLQEPLMANPQTSSFVKSYLPYQHPERGALVLRTRTAAVEKSMGITSPVVHSIPCQPNMTLTSLLHRYRSKGILDLSIATESIPRVFSALHVSAMTKEEYIALYPATEALIRRKLEVDNECTICLEPCEYPTMVNCCFQLYCGACLLRSMLIRLPHARCSVCRGTLLLQNLTWIPSPSASSEVMAPLQSKYQTCLEICSSVAQGGKVVIYTAYENIFYDMFEALGERGLHAERLENHLFSMRKTMRRYKEGKTTILFVSQEEAIRGLNLSETTHLIFYHEPSSSEKRQCLLDAMQRVGRSTPLQVIHLPSEIEV